MTSQQPQQILYPHSVYPIIKTELEVNEMINKSLNQSRITEMSNQRNILQKDLKRYIKLKKRWKRVNTGFIITDVVVIGITGVAAALTGAVIPPALIIPILTPAVPIVLTSLGVLETVALTGLEIGIFKRKIDFYDKKCKLI